MVGWLIGNTVFSETAQRIFLIFCMTLGDYKGRKVTGPNCLEKFMIWRYLWQCLQISPKSDTLILFSKAALRIFLIFGLKFTKYDLQFEWNLFFRKISYLEIFDIEIVKKLPKLRFLAIFFDSLVFPDFAHNDWWHDV